MHARCTCSPAFFCARSTSHASRVGGRFLPSAVVHSMHLNPPRRIGPACCRTGGIFASCPSPTTPREGQTLHIPRRAAQSQSRALAQLGGAGVQAARSCCGPRTSSRCCSGAPPCGSMASPARLRSTASAASASPSTTAGLHARGPAHAHMHTQAHTCFSMSRCQRWPCDHRIGQARALAACRDGSRQRAPSSVPPTRAARTGCSSARPGRHGRPSRCTERALQRTLFSAPRGMADPRSARRCRARAR